MTAATAHHDQRVSTRHGSMFKVQTRNSRACLPCCFCYGGDNKSNNSTYVQTTKLEGIKQKTRKPKRLIFSGESIDEMETVMEDEEYNYREVILPTLIPIVPEPGLERETGERRRGRDIVIAVDHGPKSKHAFDWALIHLVRLADTIHLVHAVSSVRNDIVYETTQALMEKLAVEAFEVAMVRSTARIVEGDAGKVICKEAERLKPAAVVMGTRGRSLIQSVLQGSVSEYCFHNCKAAPVIIVPGKEAGDVSLI